MGWRYIRPASHLLRVASTHIGHIWLYTYLDQASQGCQERPVVFDSVVMGDLLMVFGIHPTKRGHHPTKRGHHPTNRGHHPTNQSEIGPGHQSEIGQGHQSEIGQGHQGDTGQGHQSEIGQGHQGDIQC